ncbi:MAG: LysM peptidoglycan-binding domain-containing protein [Balneolaceae bacterium]|nr:MAG: LysM peptidoglycan-binding domain-containing protein [Balneolaceae bacterium]
MVPKKIFNFTAILFITITFQLINSQDLFAQDVPREHVVQQGETLFSISREYAITVGELRSWNNLSSDNLQPGQVLRLLPPAGEGRVIHRVAPGESLFAISRRYGVTIAEIQQWNNISGTSLDAGQELIIYQQDGTGTEDLPPTVNQVERMDEQERRSVVRNAEDSATGSGTYTVRSGDTLYQIARQHDMSVTELRQLNGIQGDILRVGQRLTVRRIQTPPSVAEGAENSTPQGKFALYRLRSGENTRTVLNRFKMTMGELEALNPDITVNNLSSGQQVTVLLPPTRNFRNPFRSDSNLEDLGTVPVTRYSDSDRATPTTSGELYSPGQLSAAHSNMQLGSIIYIENPSNKRGVFVRVNDRHSGDGLKISGKAYELLGFTTIEQPMVTIYLEN